MCVLGLLQFPRCWCLLWCHTLLTQGQRRLLWLEVARESKDWCRRSGRPWWKFKPVQTVANKANPEQKGQCVAALVSCANVTRCGWRKGSRSCPRGASCTAQLSAVQRHAAGRKHTHTSTTVLLPLDTPFVWWCRSGGVGIERLWPNSPFRVCVCVCMVSVILKSIFMI